MISKFHHIILLSCSILLFSCGGSKQVAENQSDSTTVENTKPSWMMQRPVNSSYYVGIGSASKISEPLNYQQVAKKNALNDLSSEIRVIIEGESFLNTIDRNYNFEEEFRSNISTRVLEDIQDFEIVDAYENGSDYWVYYRLSKSEHARIKKEKKDKALNSAFDFYTKGQDAIELNNFAVGFDLYLRSLLEMKDYWNEVNLHPSPSGDIYLDNEIYSSLRTLGSELKIEVESNPILLESSNSFAKEVQVTVTRNGSPVNGVHLSYQYDKGKYSRPAGLITDDQGKIIIPVKEVNLKSSSIYLAIWIDLNDQVSKDLDKSLITPLVSGIKTQELNIPIRLVYPKLFFASNEMNFGKADDIHRLRDAFASKLSSEGFSSTSRLVDSDYEILIQSNTTEGGTSQGFHVVYLDMSVSIKSRITQDEIFKRSFTKIKGLQLNYESAASEAYKKAAKSLEEEVSREFIEQLF